MGKNSPWYILRFLHQCLNCFLLFPSSVSFIFSFLFIFFFCPMTVFLFFASFVLSQWAENEAHTWSLFLSLSDHLRPARLGQLCHRCAAQTQLWTRADQKTARMTSSRRRERGPVAFHLHRGPWDRGWGEREPGSLLPLTLRITINVYEHKEPSFMCSSFKQENILC